MHKNFSFKGMVRSNDNILADDGECLELINMRTVNGALRPIPEFVENVGLEGTYSEIYWHDKAMCYFCIKNNTTRDVDLYDSEWQRLLDNHGAKLYFPLLKSVRMIEFVGYVAACMTDTGILYLIYSGGTYRWLGDSPIVPVLKITPSSSVHEINTDSTFTTSLVDSTISSLWQYNSRGYFDECISKANKEGYYIDRALFRFALRLYDGSYIYTSHIIYVSDESVLSGIYRDSGNLVATKNNETATESTYKVRVLGFKPQFEFQNLKLEDWDGVIVGIDVFTTGSIMGKGITEARVSVLDTETKLRTTEKFEVYKDKELNELWNEVSDASLYYKIAEYSIGGKCMTSVDDVSQSNIVMQDSLNSFEQRQSFSSIVPECSYMFNNRLHIASLREYFFKGYERSSLLPAYTGKEMLDMVVVKTKIKTQNGTSVVMNYFENVYVGYDSDKETYMLPPLLSYPDSRAYEMTVFICYDTEWFRKSFPLLPHKHLNISQYLHKWYLGYAVTIESVFANGGTAGTMPITDVLELFNEELGVHEVIYSNTLNKWTYKGQAFPPEKYSSHRIFFIPRDIENGDKIVFTISKSVADTTFRDIDCIPFDSTWELLTGIDDCGEEENVYEDKENVMKVSMVDNPFVFPAKCTYPFSQGRVMALSTNRVAMSEGQFGEHPLYVFSQEGIQVMAVDASGATAYSNIYPVSHEVCQNAAMVCGTDYGVLFLGTQGVMLISGNRCIRLSVAIDNETKDVEVLKRNNIIGKIASLYGLGFVVDAGEFFNFMRGSKVVRYAEMDELMFLNSNYGYSYIYSMSAKVWSKINISFNGSVRAGGTFALFRNNDDATHIYVPGDNFTGSNNVMLLTRPHLFGTKLPKRIMQLMLHAYLSKGKGSGSSAAFVSCFLLCSNDGVNFKLVSGCEKKNETQDVLFPYFPTQSYRYFVFALAGNLNTMSMISGLELDISPAWNNRLR